MGIVLQWSKEELYWYIFSYNYDTGTIIEHMTIGFIQPMVVFIIKWQSLIILTMW